LNSLRGDPAAQRGWRGRRAGTVEGVPRVRGARRRGQLLAGCDWRLRQQPLPAAVLQKFEAWIQRNRRAG